MTGVLYILKIWPEIWYSTSIFEGPEIPHPDDHLVVPVDNVL